MENSHNLNNSQSEQTKEKKVLTQDTKMIK